MSHHRNGNGNEQDDDVLITLLGSATAGSIARLICHPIDTVKSNLQAANVSNQRIRQELWKGGFKGLYRGIGAVMTGGIPGVAIYLTTYEKTKQFLETSVQLPSFAIHFFSGMMAEAAGCVVFVPMDVIKERLQVQSLLSNTLSTSSNSNNNSNNTVFSSRQYSGSANALRSIVRSEGIVSGLYRGYAATLLCYGPFSAIYFTTYEQLKDALKSKLYPASNNNNNELTFAESLLCAAVAGSFASLITSPLDMAKLRLQVQLRPQQQQQQQQQQTLMGALREVYSTGGVRGLFRGAGTRILFHTPNTALTMATFEQSKQLWATVLQLRQQ